MSGDQGDAVPRCPQCHTLAEGPVADGSPAVLDRADWRQLADFLAGRSSLAACAACQTPLSVRPTLLFPLADRPGMILAGTSPASLARLDALRRAGVIEVADRATLTRLIRASLWDRLGVLTGPAADILAGGATPEYLTGWRACTPDAVVAAVVVQAGAERGLPPAFLAQAQALIWWNLAVDWGGARRPATGSLQSDLDRYVYLPAVLPDAVNAYEQLAAAGTGVSQYVARAVGAHLRATTGTPNPERQQWAAALLSREIAVALGSGTDRGWSTAAVGESIVALGAKSTDTVEALSLDPALLAPTLDHASLWAAALHAHAALVGQGHSPVQSLRMLDRAARRIGHQRLTPALAEVVLAAGSRTSGAHTDVASADAAVAEMAAARPAGADPERLRAIAIRHGRALAASGDIAGLHRTAAGLQAVLGDGADARARARAWLAARLNAAGRAHEALAVTGSQPSPEENQLSPRPRAELWTERGGALARLGRTGEARAVQQRVLEIFATAGDLLGYRSAQVRLAQYLLDDASPDAAARLVEEAISAPDGLGPDPELLRILATAHAATGRSADALAALETAQGMASDPPLRAELATLRAQQLLALGKVGEAVRVLIEERPAEAVQRLGAAGLFAETACWLMLLWNGHPMPPAGRGRILAVIPRLAALAAELEFTGDLASAATALDRCAELVEAQTRHGSEAVDRWRAADRFRLRHQLARNPRTLAFLAWHEQEQGNPDQARKLLLDLPGAWAQEFGEARDIESVLHLTARLQRPLAHAAGAFLAGGGRPADLRLLGELQRDTVLRARAARQRGIRAVLAAEEIPSDRSLAALAATPTGAAAGAGTGIVVLEWVRTGARTLVCLRTRLGDGEVDAALVPQVPINPKALTEWLQTAAEGSASGSGDPFDANGDWRRLAGWATDCVAEVAVPGDHVVVIPHAAYSGVPWHIPLGRRWTTSYTSSWSRLLHTAGSPPADRSRVGALVVPRARDSEPARTALRAATEWLRATGAGESGPLVIGPLADRRAVLDLLENADVAVLVCHGYVRTGETTGENEVALVIAAHGQLPPSGSVSFDASSAQAHRFSWRACAELSRAPGIVLSAACTTGVTFAAGLGERLGLFGALADHGTRTLVAPAWPIDTKHGLPVLVQVAARVVAGQPTAEAVHAVRLEAEEAGMPPLQAASLICEGDWR